MIFSNSVHVILSLVVLTSSITFSANQHNGPDGRETSERGTEIRMTTDSEIQAPAQSSCSDTKAPFDRDTLPILTLGNSMGFRNLFVFVTTLSSSKPFQFVQVCGSPDNGVTWNTHDLAWGPGGPYSWLTGASHVGSPYRLMAWENYYDGPGSTGGLISS